MIELYAALGVLDALVLAVLISVQGQWAWRAATIVVALGVNLGLLWAVPDTAGFASRSQPPSEAQFLACAIEEPTYIYLWLVEREPRAYRVVYSRELHRVCEQARSAAAQGVNVGLRRRSGGTRGLGPAGRYVPYVLPPRGQPKEGGQ